MELKRYEEYGLQPFPLLLIVPYGIETLKNLLFFASCPAFNRTLWN